MVYKYLYIDDQDSYNLGSFIQAIVGNSQNISINSEQPKPFDEQIAYLRDTFKSYDGLILDWRLDEIAPSGGKPVQFRAAALAQEIRTRGTEEGIKELPIVLFSTYNKLSNSYYGDNTSHDLFDRRYNKDEIRTKSKLIQEELLALAKGYQILNEERKQDPSNRIFKLLGISKEEQKNLDVRFISHFQTPQRLSSHGYARFIIQQLLNRPDPLINEELLAARLGIDFHHSPDWKTLLERLPETTRYKGIFHEAWPRWWSHIIEQIWWPSLGNKVRPLSVYDAEERVERIREYTGLKDLIVAEPFLPSYSNKFYTICEHHRCPLDPLDGVILDEPEPEPWQNRRYLSLDAALKRLGEVDPNHKLFPHPTEQKRLRTLRSIPYES
jgi:hypothetical protein